MEGLDQFVDRLLTLSEISLRLGMPAKIHIDAIPDKEYAGHVAEIGSSAAARQSAGAGIRYFKVKVAIDNPDDRLRSHFCSLLIPCSTRT